MIPILIYGMVYLGAALMVVNIVRYVRYACHLLNSGDWEKERRFMCVPIALLSFFLVGYLAVAFFGKPDLMFASILFLGSVFVFLMLLVLQRVTVRIRQDEQLRADTKAAEDTNRAKSSFLANMSHEIRTPMNAIIGLESMARLNPNIPQETREQLEKIDVNAKRMLEVVNDILDMARIESGRVELHEESFVLKDFLNKLNESYRTDCARKGLAYRFTLQGEPETCYLGDSQKLYHVLGHLLDNAVKYTNRPGSVSLTVEADPPRGEYCPMRFLVSDTGVGIDPDFLPRLFDPFSKEDARATSRYDGSGLGLSIVHNLVEMLNGEIRVESEKGKGSTFTVSLSLRRVTEDAQPAPSAGQPSDETEQTAQSAPQENEEPSLAGKHVLIAEDIEINAEILADLLELEDVSSEWAENGQIALDLFAGSEIGHFDAILMDLRMPVMDGLAATREIRKLKRPDAKTVPIIAITANAFPEDVERCMQAGMDMHIAKPADSDLLMQTLSRLIASRSGAGQ